MVGARHYQISQVLDLEQVLVCDLQSGDIRQIPLSDLSPLSLDEVQKTAASEHDAQQLSDAHWAIAQHRLAVIRPLLERDHYGLHDVQAQAKASGYSTATLYRWLQHYQHSGLLSALVPCPRGASPGQRRLAPEVDAIIDATIEDCYLSEQKPSMRRTAIEVERRCRNAKLSPPHANTVRNRIRRLSPRTALRHRGGSKIARDRFEPIRGPYPDADWPLAIWQIDHTPVDLILVDDQHRRPVGRPWITLAIDVFSRMVAGFYISFDPPGAMAVGLCLAHAILPKETWLAKHDIKTAWPLWGKPAAVHADNAKEFRGKMLSRACENLMIDLYWRPVARPNFGGHIERLCGTLNDAIHALPGTTFSNVQKRSAYPAEDKAVFTLSEFETWLAIQIVEVYHQQRHSGIGMAPVKKYEQGIFGNAEQPGIGLPERYVDEPRLRLELMPYEERTVQRYGIQLDDIFYYHEVLKPWVNAVDPADVKRKRKFVVRRDPRDISVIYFYDPELNEFFAIPYRNTAHPAISVWELREAKRRLKEEGHQEIDEALIFAAYNRLKAIEQAALRETKAARRKAQRQRLHNATEGVVKPAADTPSRVPESDNGDDIEPFDELEEWDD